VHSPLCGILRKIFEDHILILIFELKESGILEISDIYRDKKILFKKQYIFEKEIGTLERNIKTRRRVSIYETVPLQSLESV
jgi:hypothetical protein